MTTKASVAVIGGGVMGASIAYHLARAGVDDVIIIDRAPGPGAGSTGRATGGFRAQFATAINVQMSLMSREALRRFKDETGVDPGYQPVGYLWLASTPQQLDAIRSAQRVQHDLGLSEARELSVAEILECNPLISDESIIGGAFCPTDGYIRPLEILRGYLESAERLGVRFLWDAKCVGLVRNGNRIETVQTTRGHVDVDTVVNAAGPWAAHVAEMAGVFLPVTPLMRQAAFTVPTSAIPPDMPMTIFMNTGFHVRARDGRALFSWPGDETPGDPGELCADPAWVNKVTDFARDRFPVLRDVDIDWESCYAGLYEMSPDHHALLGKSPKCDNMFFANGSSGHGVMHSPAIGSIIADMICEKKPQLDVSMLRPSRFKEGQPLSANELL
ncbi:MAG TPA: FAD-dependent oxidoreductase [Gemmatimonadaceae bacterium]